MTEGIITKRLRELDEECEKCKKCFALSESGWKRICEDCQRNIKRNLLKSLQEELEGLRSEVYDVRDEIMRASDKFQEGHIDGARYILEEIIGKEE
ncbi:MAG: hypothetical protein ACTSPB_02145 [Candidatus Thorarchaeota archaeon]